ncbi:MAG: hypothetical protein FD180_1032, partial [Planctomycetota bacterium]
AAALIALSIGAPVPGSRTLGLEPARAADEIAGAWAEWLRARVRRGPVLLCIEDLHWADAGTRALLAQLASRLSREAIAIVATSRPGPAIPEGFELLTLGDLTPESATRLATNLLGTLATPELVREIVDRAGGHPYFIEELARAVRSRASGTESKALPDSLLGLLVSRLDEQPVEIREALKAASAFGRAFWPALVAEAAGGLTADPFEEALRRELVMVQPSSLVPGERQLAFRHALLRDAAYSLLPRKDRQRLHAAAASALESRYFSGGRKLRAMSANHLRLAGDELGAAARWESAALEAEGARAVGEVAEYALAALSIRLSTPAAMSAARALSAFTRYSEVLEVCVRGLSQKGLPPGERAAFELMAASAEQGQGRFEDAVRRITAVPADSLAPIELLRLELMRLSNLQLLNKWAEVDAGLPAVERHLEASRSPALSPAWLELRSSAWNMHGIRAWHEGKAAIALDCYGKAAEVARQAGHVLGQAACEHNRAMVLIAMSRNEDAVEACDRSIRLRLDAGYRQRIGTTLVQRAGALSALGKDDEARSALQEALRLHRAAGDATSESIALATLAELDASTGRRQDGLGVVQEILRLEKSGAPEARAVTLIRCANILESCGELAHALSHAREALEIRERVGAPRVVGITLRLLGRIECELGMRPESEAHFSRAAAVFESLGDVLNAIRTLATMADSLVRTGEFEGADDGVRRGRELSRGLDPGAELLEFHRIEADVHAARGEPAKAVAAYAVSAAMASGLRRQPEAAQALAGQAQALLDLGRGQEGQALVDEAARLVMDRNRPQLEAAVELVRGEISASREQVHEALAAFSRAGTLLAGGRPSVETIRAHTLLARFLDFLRPDGAMAELEAAERDAAAISDPLGLLLAASTRARLESRGGRGKEALRILETLPSMLPLARVPFRDRLRLMSDEARIRHGAGDVERARALAGDGLRQARECGAVLQAGHFERLLEELK